MADDLTVPATGAVLATDDDGTRHWPWEKLAWGPDGTFNKVDTATGKPLPIQVRSATGLIPIGEPTDAKSTATDTTSVTLISISKQISASAQLTVTGLDTINTSIVNGTGPVGAGTAAAAQRTTLASDDPAVVALQIIDDWDETDRAKVNIIVGQAGVAAGAGAVAATVQRMTLASDDPAVATLGATSGAAVVTDATGTIQQYLRGLVKRWVDALGAGTSAAALRTTTASDSPVIAVYGGVTETAPATDTASSGLNGRLQRIAQRLTTLLVPGAGTAATALRSTLASDDPAVVSLQIIDDWDESDRAKVNPIVGQAGVAAGAGAVAATVQRFTLASDDPAVATLGATSGAAVVTDATGTIQQYLRGLVKRWVDALGAGTAAAALRTTLASDDPAVAHLAIIKQPGLSAVVTVTRPSDTTAYTAGDVLGPTGGGTSGIDFNLAAISGSNIMITSATLTRNVAALISGETSYKLYLYNVTPPGALADNAVFDLSSGDRTAYLGVIDLGTPVDLVSTLSVQTDGINKQVKLSGTHIFGYLVTVGAYTPASASVLVVTLSAMQL